MKAINNRYQNPELNSNLSLNKTTINSSILNKINKIKDIVVLWIKELLNLKKEDNNKQEIIAKDFCSSLNIKKMPVVEWEKWSIIQTSWIIETWFPKPNKLLNSKDDIDFFLNNHKKMPVVEWEKWSIISTWDLLAA